MYNHKLHNQNQICKLNTSKTKKSVAFLSKGLIWYASWHFVDLCIDNIAQLILSLAYLCCHVKSDEISSWTVGRHLFIHNVLMLSGPHITVMNTTYILFVVVNLQLKS